MLLLIEWNTVTEKTEIFIQTTQKKLQKTNRINYGMNFYDHTNQDSQFQEPMIMDNTKSENKLFTKSNYLT